MNTEIIPTRTTPHWDLYRRECFMLSASQQKPMFDTDPEALEEKAKATLTEGGWLYAWSNAGLGSTHRANREAFHRHRIVPRMLVDTNARDTSIELFGHKLAAPILFAPVGINKIYHPAGELNSAIVAKELGLGYCLSTAASQSMEDVAIANGKGTDQDGVRFFQLYCPPGEDLEDSLLKRAVDEGFTACIWTVDTWQLAWRHHDVATANYAFYRGVGFEMGASDPVFQQMMKDRGIDPKTNPSEAGQLWIDQVWHGHAFGFEKLPKLIKKWKALSGGKPFLVKGVQSAVDAKRCIELGADGVVCSNHAGRQVDGAVGSLDQLEEIVAAVGDRGTVLFDSGIRGGADVFKALALGAKAVLVGRLWVYGMSIAGEAGVRHVMKSLLADFDILMGVGGFNSIAEITKDSLKFMPYGSSGGVTGPSGNI